MSIWVTGSLEVRNTSGDLVFQVGDSAVANPDPTPMSFRSSIVEGSFEVIGDQDVSHKILTASYSGGTNGARVGVGVSAATNVALAVGGDLGLSDSSSDRRIVVESANALGDAYLNAGYDNSNRLFIMWEGSEKRIRMGTRESGSTYFSSFIIKSGSADVQNTLTAGGDIKAGGSLQTGTGRILASDGGTSILVDTDDSVAIVGELTANTNAHVTENLNVTGSFEMGTSAVANFGAGSTLNFGANSSIDCASFTIDSTSNITLDSDVSRVYIKNAGADRFSFTDGNLTIHNESNTNDYFAVDVGANGATILSTIDDGVDASGHLYVNPDGMIQLQPIGGVRIVGTNPYLRIGDGGAEDVKIEFYYQAAGTLYYHAGVDNTDSIFKIGYGNVVGTDSAIEVDTTTSVNVNLPMTVNDTITLENGATIGNGVSGRIDLSATTTRLSGDLQVAGNDIKNSGGDNVITFTNLDLTTYGSVSTTAGTLSSGNPYEPLSLAGLVVNCSNNDVAIIRAQSNGSSVGFGYSLVYEGSGTGNDNALVLTSDNVDDAAGPVEAFRVTQDGIMDIPQLRYQFTDKCKYSTTTTDTAEKIIDMGDKTGVLPITSNGVDTCFTTCWIAPEAGSFTGFKFLSECTWGQFTISGNTHTLKVYKQSASQQGALSTLSPTLTYNFGYIYSTSTGIIAAGKVQEYDSNDVTFSKGDKLWFTVTQLQSTGFYYADGSSAGTSTTQFSHFMPNFVLDRS